MRCGRPADFEAVETYIHKTLDQKSRIRLKLRNPLGVGERLAASYLELARNRLALLAEDLKAIENIEGQLEIYRSDMQNDFRYRMADIEKVLLAMNNRGMVYFDETLRLARVLDLVNTQRIQSEFERKVVADTPYQIETGGQRPDRLAGGQGPAPVAGDPGVPGAPPGQGP